MIGLKKEGILRNGKGRKVVFTGFGVQGEKGFLQAKENFNCDCRDGKLKRGVGVAPYRHAGQYVMVSVGLEVAQAFVLSTNEGGIAVDYSSYYVLTKAGDLMLVNPLSGETTLLRNINATQVRIGVLRDQTRKIHNILFTGNAAYSLVGNTLTTLWAGSVIDGCVVGGRVFVLVARNWLRYTAPMEPTNFNGKADEGGQLYVPPSCGEVVGLQTDGEALYLFAERGIFRLEVSSRASQFRLVRLAYTGDKICQKAQVGLNGSILFLALDGIYRLVGERVEKICAHLPIRPADAKGDFRTGYCGDLVLLEYNSWGAGGGNKLRRLAVYADGEEGFFADDYGALTGGEICCISNVFFAFTRDEVMTTHRSDPSFRSVPLRFGREGCKTLTKIRLRGMGRCRLYVRTDGKLSMYQLQIEEGVGEVKLLERGVEFVFTLLPSLGAVLDSLEIEYVGG